MTRRVRDLAARASVLAGTLAVLGACTTPAAQEGAPAPAAAAEEPVPAPADATAGAPSREPPPADVPSEGATLRVALDPGAVLWFERTERTERTFGEPDETPYVTEVTTLARVEVGDVGARGVDVTLRFERVHGYVVDSDRLDFDTDGVVPQVYCRLDDVRSDIALAKCEVRVTIAPSGKVRLRSLVRPDGEPALAAMGPAILWVKGLLGDEVPRDHSVALGDSWEGAPSFFSNALGASFDGTVRTQVRTVDADTVELRVRGDATLATDRRDATEESPAPGGTARWTETLVLSRADGLAVRYDRTQRNVMTDLGRSMDTGIRVVLRRVPAPAVAE